MASPFPEPGLARLRRHLARQPLALTLVAIRLRLLLRSGLADAGEGEPQEAPKAAPTAG